MTASHLFALALLLGASFGLGIFVGSYRSAPSTAAAPPRSASAQVWTCSMHPQIRLPGPGKCPICSMPLIPADGGAGGTSDEDGSTLTLGPRARALARVETEVVGRRPLHHEIRTIGKLTFDETGLATVTTRVNGYIERLFADVTGTPVSKGDALVEIYSPDLTVAQQELLVAGRAGGTLLESTRRKLRWYGITEAQIEDIVKTGKIQERMTIFSPISGTVIERMVVEQSYVETGATLYRLADLERLWVFLEAYELDLPSVRVGQEVELVAEGRPDVPVSGRIAFVSPVLEEATRTVKVRVDVPNPDGALKPGMFVSARIRVRLGADGRVAPTGIEGQWTCPMHPEVLKPRAGACPVCRMPLQRHPQAAPGRSTEDPLAIPGTAVLDSGTRKLVYVEPMAGDYEPREVRVGPIAAGWYPVLDGLYEGERVVVQGGLLLDSQFQIQGLPSLLSQPPEPDLETTTAPIDQDDPGGSSPGVPPEPDHSAHSMSSRGPEGR